jgi:hypothetical protein|tara:strand:- start:1558 stop:2049 length:492 start_codon:yes stop_codon:yes gene_type:complete
MPDLIEQYKQLHKEGKFTGYSLIPHAPAITKLVQNHKATSLLDWGCGKGQQYHIARAHAAWGFMPKLYDPAVGGISRKPVGKYDGVICTDVAEHVPEEDVPAFLTELVAHAKKFLFISVCTRPAKKNLPDGRNCHLCVKPEKWWLNQISALKAEIEIEVAWNE